MNDPAATRHVVGLGGVFIRARDPRALSDWYRRHLGVPLAPAGGEDPPWEPAAGPTVFAAFTESSTHLGRPEQRWMLNFRVTDLPGLVRQLRSAGIEVEADAEEYAFGRFARLNDPEGNPIELWEPSGA
ncbi:MAG: VOC family protein [Gammaproteobacteria bacterium]|nr:VOC family protein [Gammaproteobacteria bacterium]